MEQDNYEVFTDLKKKMKNMKIHSLDPVAMSTNENEDIDNEEITTDLAMKKQIEAESDDQLPQTKPRIGIKPVVIKRFQVTLASESK
nr:unnamed protein product [Callosobruchus analis]